MAVAVLNLAARPTSVLVKVRRNTSLAGVLRQAVRMRDRGRVLTTFAEGDQVVGAGYVGLSRVLDNLPMGCRDVGVISRAIWGGALQVAPPLSTTEAEIDEMVELFRVGLTS